MFYSPELLNWWTLTNTKPKKIRKNKKWNTEWAGIVLMLNKQTPSATNYAVQSMKWHFTTALWCFILTSLPNKALSHIYLYVQTYCFALSIFLTRLRCKLIEPATVKETLLCTMLHCSNQRKVVKTTRLAQQNEHSRNSLCINSP